MTTSKEAARDRRIDGYAQWIVDDVSGLISNIAPIFGDRHPGSTVLLAEARAKVVAALTALDDAIAADTAANAEEHV